MRGYPSELLESELFGHEKGAFTGAALRHEGWARSERGKGSFSWTRLPSLRQISRRNYWVVQERRFFRLGGEEPVRFNARLMCATNAELEKEVESGRFRRDLYYRINVISIRIPPLRERREDISPLLDKYLAQFSEAFRTEVRGASMLAEEVALVYHWPGNVRELRNRAERAIALAQGPWLGPADIFPDLVPQALLSDTAAWFSRWRPCAMRRSSAILALSSNGQVVR